MDLTASESTIATDLLRALRGVRFPMNFERKGVMRADERGVHSLTLGYITPRGRTLNTNPDLAPRISLRTYKPKFREVVRFAIALMRAHNPAFSFSSICVNYNVSCAKHCDANNAGPTYIVGLGDYCGGALRVHRCDGRAARDVDIKNRWLCFDAAKQPHETLPFIGERYSLCYYSVRPRACIGGASPVLAYPLPTPARGSRMRAGSTPRANRGPSAGERAAIDGVSVSSRAS